MIPKKIHYCWFGRKELPDLAKKCIQSWKTHLPDYEIVEWNESNFDISSNKYVYQAYIEKKYAFVSDYARFHILYNEGGIYMDTDVEVIKSLNIFLTHNVFMGFEGNNGVNPGLIIGAVKYNPIINEILNNYLNFNFIYDDGSLNLTTVVKYTTDVLIKYGLVLNGKKQEINGITIYSNDYFCPLDYKTKKMTITTHTHTIHHYSASWYSPYQKFKMHIIKLLGHRTTSLILKGINRFNFKIKKS